MYNSFEHLFTRKKPVSSPDQPILKIFYRYYRDVDDDFVSFMPLLMYCLAHRHCLFVTDKINNQDNLLFSITNSKNDSFVGVGYRISKGVYSAWQPVIEFYVSDFVARINRKTGNNHSDAHFCVSDGSVLDIELHRLCSFAIELLDFPDKKEELCDLRKAILYHLKYIDNWTASNANSLKLLRFMNEILYLHKSCTIYNPSASIALETFFLSSTQSLTGYAGSEKSYYLGKLLILSQKRENIDNWSLNSSHSNSEGSYDYIIFDSSLEFESTPFYDDEEESLKVKIVDQCLHQLSPRGRMVFSIFAPNASGNKYKLIIAELLAEKWLQRIYSFNNNLLILEIDKKNDYDDPSSRVFVEYVYKQNSFPCYDNSNELFSKGDDSFLISPYEFYINDYNLTINPIARSLIDHEHEKGFEYVRLGALVDNKDYVKEDYCSTENGLLSVDDIKQKEISTYPLCPFVSALDGGPIMDQKLYCKTVQNCSIIFDSYDESKFNPLIFDDQWGDMPTNAYFATINRKRIDPEYLILQISDNFFKLQLDKSQKRLHSKGEKYNFAELLHSLYVKIPDCSTSLERQKQIVSSAKWQHIQNTASTIGKDLSILSTVDDSCLKKETSLSHDKYIIKEFLGHGGFGRTYLALNKSPEYYEPTKVAVKEFFVNGYQKRNPETNEVIPCLDKNLHLLENARKKFYREASIIKEFSDCPNIIKVFDVFDENGTTYYTMEYMENGDLCNYCKHMGKHSILEVFDAKRIIREVANALSIMHHHKFNHLDVKPSNILIDNDGHAKLIDFGTVKFFGADTTMTTCKISSPGYSAPEIYQLKEFSPQADIYSLGATLRYMLEGDAAYSDCSGFSLPKPTIPTQLKTLIDQCLDNEPSCRPKDIEDFLKRLNCC